MWYYYLRQMALNFYLFIFIPGLFKNQKIVSQKNAQVDVLFASHFRGLVDILIPGHHRPSNLKAFPYSVF